MVMLITFGRNENQAHRMGAPLVAQAPVKQVVEGNPFGNADPEPAKDAANEPGKDPFGNPLPALAS